MMVCERERERVCEEDDTGMGSGEREQLHRPSVIHDTCKTHAIKF